MKVGEIYRWNGNSNRPKIICLHGFLGRGSDFKIVADRFSEHPDIIAPDFPDYANEAQCSGHPWATALEQLDKLIAKETDNQPFILLGYSMGGRIALQYALKFQHRLKGLVLIGATPGIKDDKLRDERKKEDQDLASNLLDEPLEVFLQKWFQKGIINTQDRIPEPYRSQMHEARKANSKTALAYYLTALGTGSMTPVWEGLPNLKTPTLLITGEEDEKFTNISGEMLTLLPNGRFHKIRGAGHAACFEQPKAFSMALKTFIQSLED
jgi:2-succinyl-6-hydroxy-2,4-cyclohexadiene-1-carboxylate synthase